MEAILKREISSNKTLNWVIGTALFTLLTALGAYVRIPLAVTPVPLTLQTFFVILSALFLGRSGALASQAAYIALGAAGVPLFSLAGSGSLYLLGPTAGYLFGFIVATFIIGTFIKGTDKNQWRVFGIVCIADCALLLCGSCWLAMLFGYPPQKAFLLGAAPFIAGDILKAWVATQLFLTAKRSL
jgi:biotin transport system substrate-specific component